MIANCNPKLINQCSTVATAKHTQCTPGWKPVRHHPDGVLFEFILSAHACPQTQTHTTDTLCTGSHCIEAKTTTHFSPRVRHPCATCRLVTVTPAPFPPTHRAQRARLPDSLMLSINLNKHFPHFHTPDLVVAAACRLLPCLPQIQIFGYNSQLYSNFSDALNRAQGIVGVSVLLQVRDANLFVCVCVCVLFCLGFVFLCSLSTACVRPEIKFNY